jgi:hypothetical protein
MIMDDYGNYSGHSIVLPLKPETYEMFKQREMTDSDFSIDDLVNYKTQERPVFFNYDITADCNDNLFYLAHDFLDFFKNISNDSYEYCSYTMRYDSYRINEQLGLQLLWENPVQRDALGLEYHPRLYIGNFKKYFSED